MAPGPCKIGSFFSSFYWIFSYFMYLLDKIIFKKPPFLVFWRSLYFSDYNGFHIDKGEL